MSGVSCLLANRAPRTLAGARIGAGALAAQRQSTPVPDAAIGAEIHETLDVHGDGTAQVALDGLSGNGITHLFDLGLAEILDLRVRLDAARRADLARRAPADTVDCRQGNLGMLVRWNIDSGYTGHSDTVSRAPPGLGVAKRA